jgi:hypothetical protein
MRKSRVSRRESWKQALERVARLALRSTPRLDVSPMNQFSPATRPVTACVLELGVSAACDLYDDTSKGVRMAT